MYKYVFTSGDINGIGPEIIVKTLNEIYKIPTNKFYIACPHNAFIDALRNISPKFKFEIVKNIKDCTERQVSVIDIGKPKITKGHPTITSGKASVKSIKVAYNLVKNNYADAMITAPISKTAIKMAGIKFTGHTEMLAEWSKVKNFAMMFLSGKINAALVSIHEPVKNISRLITKTRLKEKIEVIYESLKIDLKIIEPKIAVLGLNPHAGEEGNIGKEEQQKIKPVLSDSYYQNFCDGPFSADAFFGNHLYENYNCVLGMYHDQVLIPFKLLNFGKGVNFTAGLPIIRTSSDHGTAFDIAGKNKADESSLIQAFNYAEKIVKNRKRHARNKRQNL